jgi:glycosyltransferase involved in cell wall biosynthesis
MNSASLISVIMPFYNTPVQFFKEAIESVFAQTYPVWELFLIDDGSINESTDLAKSYVRDFPGKVKYLEHENHRNRGPSASRNLGIRSSKGEFIAFLDSDDVWMPRKLEEQLAVMGSHPDAMMSYGKSKYWWSWTGDPEDAERDKIQEHAIQGNMIYDSPKLLELFLRGKAAIPCTNSVMVTRDAVGKVGGFEEAPELSIWEDQAFYAKVCLENRVFVAENRWDLYRQHPESSCAVTDKSGQTKAVHLIYLGWLERYLEQRGFRDTEIWGTLKREFWLQNHWKVGRRIKRAERFIGRLKGTYPLCMEKKPK